MSVKKLVKHLDAAFVNEDRGLPPFVERILGGVESWLHAETDALEVPTFKMNNKDLRLRKASLFLAGLAKRVEYCCLIKRTDQQGILLQEYHRTKNIRSSKKMISLPVCELNRIFSISVTKLSQSVECLKNQSSDQKAQLFNIDEDYSLILLTDLPETQKRALLVKVGESIHKIRL